MANKPSIPKGTRDFSPTEMLRRKYIFSTIEKVFQKYGFLPLETPAMENLETLTGKYGEEGDRLIFKILNSGDAWGGVSEEVKKGLATGEVAPGKFASAVSEKALRYDLTVPFARYVVQHQNEIAFPFKRYQIQPVWRADRPQKGRYREFYQCDADVIGSTSLLNEVELVQLFDDVFSALGLHVVVKINDRKVLSGIAEVSGQPEKVVDIVTAIDKLDKIGREKVEEEMRAKGVSDEAIKGIAPLFDLKGSWSEQRPLLEKWLSSSPMAQQGLKDLSFTFEAVGALKSAKLEYDPTLARGLDYYTGAIFEVKAAEGTMPGSICGGGRYDDLTGIFGLKNMSGVGISFGADRIYDVLLETNKFPTELGGSTKLLFANFGEAEAMHCLKLLRTVREAGIAAELYPDQVKMAKQFKYADDKGIAYVAIIGENELIQGIVTVKDMKTGEQKAVKQDELISAIA
ncbi:MAG TPA: histidine--tRNA ligase [Flavobacteriales bacterium]|jgi:histidyl-tRNA synthetase|nr:histidine--tRNA ligase [Flavobacteriales bacterium]MBK7100402.1 histidine--tRNA ligase [Flavobacteriales bacterium]MBK7111097.1 histidine--tRNA ligase [Flavobacteriales bacterium]MBK7481162.1 histidine--tRNA ligase [Flavobacteriales bacterium]MBK7617948.1 histidine--tRNA ligase [Flavobacteriales bacterium]